MSDENPEIDRSLREWQIAINKWAEEKGWNEHIDSRTQGDWAALAHSEISEALEAFRKQGHVVMYHSTFRDDNGVTRLHEKPEGVVVEYADLIIRILHWAEVHGFDMGEYVSLKMSYNATRPHRHGDVGRV